MAATNRADGASAVPPADDRIQAGSFNIPPAELPETAFPASFDPKQVAAEFVETLNRRLEARDYAGVADLFAATGCWRDHLALSWDLRSLAGPAKIQEYLTRHGASLKEIAVDDSKPYFAPAVSPLDAEGRSQCVAFGLAVATRVGTGQGVARLIYAADGRWKAYGLYTALRELTGFEEPRGPRRPTGHEHRGDKGTKNWQEARVADANFEGSEPAVLIIGAGQGGLAAAARLKMLNVESLIVDREARVGDNWRSRYRQLVLHDPVWFDHMPYLEFPAHWPVFTPKDKLAGFFEAYAQLLELNVWTRTTMTAAAWDEAARRWTVTVERQVGDATETRTFHPRHVIQATGHSGKKNFPTIQGMDGFKGRLCHSSEFPGAQPNAEGKRAIVVGSCNSGHDIAQDLYDHGYDVTMVQRSSTCVVSSEAITEVALGPLYAEGRPPVDDADLLLWSLPRAVHKRMQVATTAAMCARDAATLGGLARAGFRLDSGPDGAGLFYKYFQRGGGYYIDVGCSRLLAEGRIRLKQGSEIAEVTADGLRFADGTDLPADELVFATGYQNMRTQTRELFGADVADRAQDVWGFDEEGEWRTLWRRSGQPGLWFMGGNLALCRYYGRFLALQIKALEEGLMSYDSA